MASMERSVRPMPFTLYQLLWYFFIYAFLGWCLEVVF